jgi:hypothetical protein
MNSTLNMNLRRLERELMLETTLGQVYIAKSLGEDEIV